MDEFFHVVGVCTIVAAVVAALGSAAWFVGQTMVQLANLGHDILCQSRRIDHQRDNVQACFERLRKLEDAIGPSEPIE